MPSINVDPRYFDHPKIKRLVHLLGRGADLLPIRLWCHAALACPESGKFTVQAAQEIESEVHWWGQKGKAIDAMLEAGLLDRLQDGCLQIHDWHEHAGHLVTYKRRARAAAEARWEKARPPPGERVDASSISMLQASPNELDCRKNGNDSVLPSLGAAWVFHSKRRRGRVKADDADDADEFLAELVKVLKCSREAMQAEIARESRDRTETLGEFKFRLKRDGLAAPPAKTITNGEVAEFNRAQRIKAGIESP